MSALTSKPAYVCPECWECAEANGFDTQEQEILDDYVDQIRWHCRDEQALIAAGLRWP